MIGVLLESRAQGGEATARLLEVGDEQLSQAEMQVGLFRRRLDDCDPALENLRKGLRVPNASIKPIESLEELRLIADLFDGARER